MEFAGKTMLSDEIPTLLVPDTSIPPDKNRAKAKGQTELCSRRH